MLEVIKKRRSVRKFLSKKVEEEKLEEVLKAAMFGPSAKHRRPWEFVVVKDKDLKEKLSQTTPYASFAKEASVVLVVCADEKKDGRWVESTAIITENIYLEATNQGLGTCFVQIRDTKTPQGDDGETYVKNLIKAPANIRVLCLMPIGYPKETVSEHKEEEFERGKIHYEAY